METYGAGQMDYSHASEVPIVPHNDSLFTPSVGYMEFMMLHDIWLGHKGTLTSTIRAMRMWATVRALVVQVYGTRFFFEMNACLPRKLQQQTPRITSPWWPSGCLAPTIYRKRLRGNPE